MNRIGERAGSLLDEPCWGRCLRACDLFKYLCHAVTLLAGDAQPGSSWRELLGLGLVLGWYDFAARTHGCYSCYCRRFNSAKDSVSISSNDCS
jgi:hypothetical protein